MKNSGDFRCANIINCLVFCSLQGTRLAQSCVAVGPQPGSTGLLMMASSPVPPLLQVLGGQILAHLRLCGSLDDFSKSGRFWRKIRQILESPQPSADKGV